jgi:hypothetical protein
LYGADQIEFILCTRDAHVKETPLLLHAFGLIERTAVRQNAIIQSDNEDRAKSALAAYRVAWGYFPQR